MRSSKFYLWIVLAVVYCFTISGTGLAQEWSTALSYQISLPSGDTKDFTDKTSFRGIGLDFRKEITRATSIGLFFGWNVFYERTSETIEIQTEKPGALTGTQDRYLNSFPIMLTVQHSFGKSGELQPYAGLNIGGFYMVQKLGIGLSQFQNDQWQWGGAPELGLIIPVERDTDIIINAKYNYAFTGESAVDADVNYSYWMIGIGCAWSGY